MAFLMKRDMDLIRTLLIQIEESASPTSLGNLVTQNPGVKFPELQYNLKQLYDAEYIKGSILEFVSSGGYDLKRIELTWKGHDFVDSVRDEEVWAKTKKGAEEARGFTIDLLKDLAKGLVKKKIEEHTGITL